MCPYLLSSLTPAGVTTNRLLGECVLTCSYMAVGVRTTSVVDLVVRIRVLVLGVVRTTSLVVQPPTVGVCYRHSSSWLHMSRPASTWLYVSALRDCNCP